MANALKGEAPIGGLTLCYNFGAFCELEQKTGKKMQELMLALQSALGFNDLADLIWAGLLKHHPDKANDADIRELVDEVGYQPAVDAVGTGVGSFFGEQAKDKNPPKAK